MAFVVFVLELLHYCVVLCCYGAQEREKVNKLSAQAQQQQSELQAMLNEEAQKVKSLQLELAAKESEIEYLSQKMALNGGDSSSIHSGNEMELDDLLLGLLFIKYLA